MAIQTGDPWWRALAADVDGAEDTDARLRSHTAHLLSDRRYQVQAHVAAELYVRARRSLRTAIVVSAPLVMMWVASVVCEISGAPTSIPLASVSWVLLLVAFAWLNGAYGRTVYVEMWLFSLRSAMGYSPIPPDVSPHAYALSVLARKRLAGEVERALVAAWHGRDNISGHDAVRSVLSARGLPDPSDPEQRYELDTDSPYPMWHRNGAPWYRCAPPVDSDHECSVSSLAMVDPGTEHALLIGRCACGAGLTEQSGWTNRNSRRD
jgi:hypothetical protein